MLPQQGLVQVLLELELEQVQRVLLEQESRLEQALLGQEREQVLALHRRCWQR